MSINTVKLPKTLLQIIIVLYLCIKYLKSSVKASRSLSALFTSSAARGQSQKSYLGHNCLYIQSQSFYWPYQSVLRFEVFCQRKHENKCSVVNKLYMGFRSLVMCKVHASKKLCFHYTMYTDCII